MVIRVVAILLTLATATTSLAAAQSRPDADLK
jgi:hypothetical protein